MNFKLGQKIIDIVRGKHLLNKYKILQETVKYISSQIGFDTEIASGILSEHKFPYFTFKKDEAILKRYIKTINASEFPKAVGILREHQIKLLDLVKEVVSDLESNNFHPFMIGGDIVGRGTSWWIYSVICVFLMDFCVGKTGDIIFKWKMS